MICLICRESEVVERLTSVCFERDEMRIVIRHAPALVCSACGEAYVEQAVAEMLLRQAVGISESGVVDIVTEYNRPW